LVLLPKQPKLYKCRQRNILVGAEPKVHALVADKAALARWCLYPSVRRESELWER